MGGGHARPSTTEARVVLVANSCIGHLLALQRGVLGGPLLLRMRFFVIANVINKINYKITHKGHFKSVLFYP